MLRKMYVRHAMSQERIEQHTCAITQDLSQTPLTRSVKSGGSAIERNHGPTISTSIMKIQDNPPNGSVVRRSASFKRHVHRTPTISPSSKHFKYASKCSPLWWKSHCHLGYFSYDWIHHHEWDIWHTYLFAKFACQQVPTSLLNPKFRGFIG